MGANKLHSSYAFVGYPKYVPASYLANPQNSMRQSFLATGFQAAIAFSLIGNFAAGAAEIATTPGGWSLAGFNPEAEVFWIRLATVGGPSEDRQVDLINYSPDKQVWRSRIHMNCTTRSLYRSFNGGLQRNKAYSFVRGSVWDSIAKRIC